MMNKKITDIISLVFERTSKSQLSPETLLELDEELTLLSDFLNISKTESIFVSVIFMFNIEEESVSIKSLSSFFNLSTIGVLSYFDILKNLCKKNIIERKSISRRNIISGVGERYYIGPVISKAMIENIPLKTRDRKMGNKEVIRNISNLLEEKSTSDISLEEMVSKVSEIFDTNPNSFLVKLSKEKGFKIEDTILFAYTVNNMLNEEEPLNLSETLSYLFDSEYEKNESEELFISGANVLIREKFIELAPDSQTGDIVIELTPCTINKLISEGLNAQSQLYCKHQNAIYPEQINEKELIFNNGLLENYNQFKLLLCEENLKKAQYRLKGKSMPTGICTLFYGSPGTGKTEFAYQIAKETSRAIFKVDISQSKSKWHGESEKIIKKIFTDYYQFSKGCNRAPILLINEADAIIAKRNNGKSNISQTENAMQNILLEELERFEGILIATTNLPENFDPAFERRFLFKIEFNKPDFEARLKIWKSKLPSISVEECKSLSFKYDISGGEIDNICRKIEISSIISGNIPNFTEIMEYCDKEVSYNSIHKQIGFRA